VSKRRKSSTQESDSDASPATAGAVPADLHKSAKVARPLSVAEVTRHPAVKEARARLAGKPNTLEESTPEDVRTTKLEIYQALSKTPPVLEGERPTIRIVMGATAAGKSTAIARMADTGEFTLVQPDNFQPRIASLRKQQYRAADAPLYLSEAGRIGSQTVERLIGERRNVLYETVAASPDRLRQLGKLAHKLGYEVELVYIPSTPEESATGALERYLDGGRFVDPETAAASVSKSQEVFDTLKDEKFVTRAEQYAKRAQKI